MPREPERRANRVGGVRGLRARAETRPSFFGVLFAALLALSTLSMGQPPTDSQNSNRTADSATAETDWPHIRGAGFDGHSPETGLADSWPTTGPPVLWTRPLGQGYSAMIAWQDRVATQYQTLAGQYVVCLDADSGSTIWQYRYGWPYEPAGVYPGPRATPTYADGRLFFAGPDGLIGCLDADTGRLRWSVNVCERFGSRGTEFGYSCSPTVVAGKVLLPVGGEGASMVALNSRDGTLAWKAGDDAASYTPAYPISFEGRPLVIGYLQNAMVCHDLESGELVWRRALSSGYDEHAAWPIYREPHLWISSPFQAGSELLELTSDPAQPVRMIGKSRLMSNDIFSSVLVDGAVYGFDLREAQAKAHRPSRGQFRCVDFLSGQEHWSLGQAKELRRDVERRDADAGTRVGHAAVIAADGKLILLNDTGELILARATAERYVELGRASVLGGEICWTQPTLSRGRVFVRNQSRAVCIYLGRPEALDHQTRSSALTVADIPQSQYVDWATLIMGVEPEYAMDLPSDEWLREWFAVSLGILGVALVIVAAARITVLRRMTPAQARWLFWITAYTLGALGTTFLSPWRGDFTFTWPVAVFVAFQALVGETRLSRSGEQNNGVWPARIALVTFAVTCVLYFLLCRRLSLVFETVFLCGFIAALPFSMAGARLFQNRRWQGVWHIVMTAAAFAAFYWSGAAVLRCYSIP